jgi:hypothetical protein
MPRNTYLCVNLSKFANLILVRYSALADAYHHHHGRENLPGSVAAVFHSCVHSTEVKNIQVERTQILKSGRSKIMKNSLCGLDSVGSGEWALQRSWAHVN